MLERLIGAVQWLSRALAALAAVLIFALVIATSADILSRNLIGEPIRGVFEYTEVALVIIVFLGIPYTMQVSGHVEIDSFMRRVPQRASRILSIVGLVFVIPFVGWWAMSSWEVAVSAWRVGEARMGVMQVPVWPARFLVPLGAVLLFLEIIISIRERFGAADHETRPANNGDA